MAAAGLLLVLLLSLSSSGNDLGGTYTLWKPRFWGPRLARADDGASPFLASQLPLKPLVTTPVDILQASSTPVPIGGRQALTVVFSRPVIALGADFGTADAFAGKAPFNVTCATSAVPAGKARWVTTTIARFDPDQDWPTDLDCSFLFNTDLTSYDGVKVDVPKAGSVRRLTSSPLFAYVSTVLSERAANASGGSWSPTPAGSSDSTPEVPPDGEVVVYFNFPVNRTLLASSLQLRPNPDNLKLNLSRCQSTWPPGPDPAAATDDAAAALDEACVSVTFSGALRDETKYELVLPASTRYSLLAGVTRKPLTLPLTGLRAFTLPIRQNFQSPTDGDVSTLWDGTRYKRLVLWLPRGLAKGTTAQQLAQQVTVSRVVPGGLEAVAINSAKLVAPSHLQLQLDGLQPRTKYRAAVAASAAILDAFGKPLKASSGDFWALPLQQFVATPNTFSPVVHFAPDDLPSEWPIATLGSDGLTIRAAVWSVDAGTDKGRATLVSLLNNLGNVLVDSVLGKPVAQVSLGNASLPQQVALPLDSAKDAQLVATCCGTTYYPKTRNVSSSVQLVLRTTLLTSWVVVPGQQVAVWVTSSDFNSPGPVQGARAFLYQIKYDGASGNSAELLGSCVTGPNGFCTLPTSTPPQDASLNLVGLVRGPQGKGGVAYSASIGYWNAQYPTPYSGALVLDRALVRPGETLHVSGYVAQKLPAGGGSWPLGAPNITLAQVTVSPSWFGNGTQVTVVVPVTESYGTLHANISVPSTATAGSYSVRLEVSPNDQFPGSGGSSADNTPPPTESVPALPPASPTGRGLRADGVAVHHAAGAAAVYPVRDHGHSHGTHSGRSWMHAAPWRRALKQASEEVPDRSGGGDASSGDGGRAPNTYIISYEQLTVSDPRPPTADLTLTAPPWATPTAAVKVSLQATSYLGSQVSNASVNVVWETDRAQGLVVATTDATGAASATIPLDTLPAANISDPGSSLRVTAEWVGPTRERIVRTASVALALAERSLSVARTLGADAPGLPWGVQVDVVSNVNGSSINGVPVLVTLAPNATAGALCNITSSCEVLSGDVASGASCQLSLPCVGTFVLTACTTAGGPPACANLTLGKNATEWQQLPYSAFDEPVLLADKTQYAIGETATLWFQNPWSPEATALVLWGNQDSPKLKSKYLGKVPIGAFKVELPLGSESRGGAGVAVLLSVPRGEGVLDLQQGFSVSLLFNPLGPHTHALVTSLNIAAPTPLGVAINVAADTTASVNGAAVPVLAPGDNVTVTVVASEDDGTPVPDAEVTLLAVDKALLDLLPYELKDLTAALALPLAASPGVTDLDATLVAAGALEAVYAAIQRRLAADPWLPADSTVIPITDLWGGPRSYLAAVDVPDDAYLDQFTTPITYGPAKSNGLCALGAPCFSDSPRSPVFDASAGGNEAVSSPAAPTPPSGISKSGDSSGGGTVSRSTSKSSSAPRLTTAFASTPLFTVFRTTTDGSGSTTFTAPQNLGTFIFRAFVVTKGVAHLGSNQTSVVVRRPLSLTASLPRIVRLGDTFLAGVLVTSPGLAANAPPSTITVTVKVLTPAGPVVLSSPLNTSSATLSGAQPQAEVRFNFTAAALGDASFEFTVTDESGASDALVASTPVLPQQSPVFVATSFALRGNASANDSSVGWQEGLALPEAAPGSGSLDLLAGVGYLPAILASTDAIAKQRATLKVAAGNLEAYASLALASVAPILATYSQELSATQLSNATDAIQTLLDLTQFDFGLLPSKPSTWSWTPTRADVLLNLQASFLVADLRTKFGGPLQGAWDSLRGVAVPQWKRAAAAQIVSDATLSRNPPSGQKPVPYQDYLSLAWARLALGVAWTIPECYTPEADLAGGVCTTDANVRKDLSLETLIAAAPKAGLEVHLITALALQTSSTAANYASFVSKAADLAVSSVRVQGRTAYVSAYTGARDAATLETQAIALRLLSALARASDAPLVQKLAAYLASAGTSGGAGALAGILPPVTPSGWVTALSAATLAKYDQKAGSTTPDLSLLATVDSAVVLKATFNKSTVGAAPATSSTPWGELASPPGALEFNVTGKGEVSVSVGLSFVPLKPLSFPSYRGIWVTSVVQLSDPATGLPTGPPLAQVPLGSVVTVTVQVTSPDDLGAVTVEALSPGGLEPLDPALTSGQGTASAAGALCPLAAWAGDAYGVAYWWWWWPICPSQSVTPRAVTWKFQRLMSGTQVLTYSAVAATEGAFVLPPIQASADDQPEVRGSTAAGTFTVGPAGSKPVPLAGSEGGAPPAKSCPKDCSGHGACNTGTGECVCSVGWKGAACDQPTAA